MPSNLYKFIHQIRIQTWEHLENFTDLWHGFVTMLAWQVPGPTTLDLC